MHKNANPDEEHKPMIKKMTCTSLLDNGISNGKGSIYIYFVVTTL